MGFRDALLPQPPSFVKKKEYAMEQVLGKGTFGKVIQATWSKAPPPGQPIREVALKVISKKFVKGNEDAVFEEMGVLKGLDHPNIIKCFDHFESRDKFYIVFELAVGGELFDRITSKGKFTEKDAREVVQSILSAIAYLHKHDIVHRDIKPENILYRTREEHSSLVIADFGIAKHLNSPDEVITTVAGSFGYAAPEILLGKGHGKAVDIWSLGIVTYVLLCGYSPFRSEDKDELVKETTRGRLEFHDRYWKNVSEEAKRFIKALVNVDPKKRLSADEALKHPWITSNETPEHDLAADFKSNFNAARKWRSTLKTIQATQRFAALSREASSVSSGMPLTPSVDPESVAGHDEIDSDAPAYHTAEEDLEDFRELKRTDEKGPMGKRLDVEGQKEQERREKLAKEGQVEDLSKKTSEVRIS